MYRSNMFDRHFRAQPTSSPALHDGSLTWDTIIAGSYEDFRSHFTALNIPRGDVDRPDTLEVLWQALRTCPRRDRVHADLRDLIAILPSVDEFTGVLHSKMGTSRGGPPASSTSISRTGLRPWKQKHMPVLRPCGPINIPQNLGNGNGSCPSRKDTLTKYRTCEQSC